MMKSCPVIGGNPTVDIWLSCQTLGPIYTWRQHQHEFDLNLWRSHWETPRCQVSGSLCCASTLPTGPHSPSSQSLTLLLLKPGSLLYTWPKEKMVFLFRFGHTFCHCRTQIQMNHKGVSRTSTMNYTPWPFYNSSCNSSTMGKVLC